MSSLRTKDKEYETERKDNVLLRFQLQDVRTRLRMKEATIAEHQWILDAHRRTQERNTELTEEQSRSTELNRLSLEERDEEIKRLRSSEENLKVRVLVCRVGSMLITVVQRELVQAKEEGRRAAVDAKQQIARLREDLQTLQVRKTASTATAAR